MRLSTLLLLGLWLCSASPLAWAGNTHTATGDQALEQRAWWGDALSGGYVVQTPAALCLHGTSANASAALSACRAYALNTGSPRQLEYIEDTASRTITYSAGDGTYWLIAHASPTASVSGWTRVLGTHYLWQVNVSQPALPSRATWLLSATVSGTAITTVTDRRTVGSPITGSFLGLSDTPDTYSGHALEFLRVKSDGSGLEFTPAAAGGAGDTITVQGAPVDTSANFVDTGDLIFLLADGGPGGPDSISAVLQADSVGPTQLADTNFGGFTCADAAGGCVLNAGSVTSTMLANATIQQADLAANSVGAAQILPASITGAHMSGDHGDVSYSGGVATVENVQCSNCIGDAEVIDTLTCSNYLSLAGGTLTGPFVTAGTGIQYTASDTNPPCTAGVYAIFADLSEQKFKRCENGVLTDLSPPDGGGGGTGTMTTVKENDVQIGTNLVTLDFLGADFDCTLGPATEVNCAIAIGITRDTELTAHAADSIDIHGIADTSQLLLRGTMTNGLLCTWNAASGRVDCVTATGGGGGTGTLTTIKENDVQIGAANMVAVDFLGADFDCSASPATEVNCVIAAAITRDTELAAHEADTTNIHGITNTANLLTTAAIGSTVQAFDSDLANLAAGPSANKITFTPTGTIAATDVQAALVEVAAEAGAGGGGLTADSVNASHMADADHGGGAWSNNVLTIQGIQSGDIFPISPEEQDQFWLLTDTVTGACVEGGGTARTLCVWQEGNWIRGTAEVDTLASVVNRGRNVTTATVETPVTLGGSTHSWFFYQDGAGVLKQRSCSNDGVTCTTFAKQLETASDWQLINESGAVCGSFDSVTMAWTGNYTGGCAPNLVVGTLLNGGLHAIDFAPGRHVGLQNCAPLEILRFRADNLGWECVNPSLHVPVVPATDVYTMLGSDCGTTIGNTDADQLEVDLLADPTGCIVCVFAKTAQTIILDPNGSDIFVVNGLTPAAGDSLTLAAGIGNNLCLQGENATTWWVFLGTGAVTDTN